MKKEGFLKTEITIVPNQPVNSPFIIVLDFDKPISQIGCLTKNLAVQHMGGDEAIGTHASCTANQGISPSYPLVVAVFSHYPVKLMALPYIEH
jgi:hypothetical protein